MCKKGLAPNLEKRTLFRVITNFVLSIPIRFILVLLRIYQFGFSPLKQFFFGPACGCRFQPTCSCYAYDAFSRFGLRKGLLFTARRLLRCHPWHPGGFDPLPDTSAGNLDQVSQ